jgi:hypothetical protein
LHLRKDDLGQPLERARFCHISRRIGVYHAGRETVTAVAAARGVGREARL